MLLEKPIAAQDVVSIKISNGDEIIAKLVSQDSNTVVVSRPLLMVLSPDPNTGMPGVQMAPFWMLGPEPDTKFPISAHHVVCMVKAGNGAMKRYMEITTGLTIPGASAGSKIIT